MAGSELKFLFRSMLLSIPRHVRSVVMNHLTGEELFQLHLVCKALHVHSHDGLAADTKRQMLHEAMRRGLTTHVAWLLKEASLISENDPDMDETWSSVIEHSHVDTLILFVQAGLMTQELKDRLVLESVIYENERMVSFLWSLGGNIDQYVDNYNEVVFNALCHETPSMLRILQAFGTSSPRDHNEARSLIRGILVHGSISVFQAFFHQLLFDIELKKYCIRYAVGYACNEEEDFDTLCERLPILVEALRLTIQSDGMVAHQMENGPLFTALHNGCIGIIDLFHELGLDDRMLIMAVLLADDIPLSIVLHLIMIRSAPVPSNTIYMMIELGRLAIVQAVVRHSSTWIQAQHILHAAMGGHIYILRELIQATIGTDAMTEACAYAKKKNLQVALDALDAARL